ncbi:MAG: hypothetical protein M0Z30_05460 [Actinomycetota bacterium]|nr:hypothetical protein [Actinomycetota bacterium]
MPKAVPASIDVSDLSLLRPDGTERSLGDLPGVAVLVLMRHRH